MEVKPLIGALKGPHKIARAPKSPQKPSKRPPRGPKWLKMTMKVTKIEKSEQNHELRSVFLLIPQTSDRLTFFSIFGTFQQRQVILRIVVHLGG